MNGRMDEENVVYIHNGVLFSYKEEEIYVFAEKWVVFDINLLK
jgi:hypothetical protein